jgi:hypothetical protein
MGTDGSSCSIGSGFFPSGTGTGVEVRIIFWTGVEERYISVLPSITVGAVEMDEVTEVLTGAGLATFSEE